MLHLYTNHDSPNGYKIVIALEELQADYQIHHINLSRGENHKAEFLALNPHGRVPVIKDDINNVILFESAAILLYLADKYQHFANFSAIEKAQSLQWMIYHSASVGPIIGQYFHFAVTENGENKSATTRFSNLMYAAFKVIDEHLAHNDYFVAGKFSIADIAHFGWFYSMQEYNLSFAHYVNIRRWFNSLLTRDAVQQSFTNMKNACAQ